MTHAELVHCAVRWLRVHHRCTIVFGELVAMTDLIPDAIGWQTGRNGWSILVECKTSRADFRADLGKRIHIDPDNAPGQERWYLTPPGLVAPEEVPAGWFLAEAGPKGVRKVRAPPWKGSQPRTPRVPGRCVAEMPYLLSALRRHTLGVPFDANAGRFETVAAQMLRKESA